MRALLIGVLAATTAVHAAVPFGRELMRAGITVRAERYSVPRIAGQAAFSLPLGELDYMAKSDVRGEGVQLLLKTAHAEIIGLIVELKVRKGADVNRFVGECRMPVFGPSGAASSCFIQTGAFDTLEELSAYPVLVSRAAVKF